MSTIESARAHLPGGRPQVVENNLRTNLSDNPDHFRVDRNGRKWLKYKYAPFSNTVKAGPILEHVQKTFPWANAVCLNKKSATSPPMAP